MMYIVCTRNPQSGKLLFLVDENEAPIEYIGEPDAYEAAMKTPLFEAWGFEILPIAI